jgi:hypothetical protein
MKHPPYHLRQNKAVERLIFMDVIRRLDKFADISQYTYYGLGGPFLEDFRMLYERFPEINMVSIENNEETFKRQKFHLPCITLQLKFMESKTFIVQYDPKEKPSIFWLDYPDLKIANIEDFQVILEKVAKNSIVKVTLRANPRDYIDRAGEKARAFQKRFSRFWPTSESVPPRNPAGFAKLLQDMLQISAQLTLPASAGIIFQPLTSFYYDDGTNIFTLTGIVCDENSREEIKSNYERMPFADLNWGKPKKIGVPALSTKERLLLQEYLPCKRNAGKRLREILGYAIDDREDDTIEMLEQYAELHRYFPYFMKAIP